MDRTGHIALQCDALALEARVRHRYAALRQVFHQMQVERQLLKAQSLEQGQHVVVFLAVALGTDEVVGVFDAAGAALQCREFA